MRRTLLLVLGLVAYAVGSVSVLAADCQWITVTFTNASNHTIHSQKNIPVCGSAGWYGVKVVDAYSAQTAQFLCREDLENGLRWYNPANGVVTPIGSAVGFWFSGATYVYSGDAPAIQYTNSHRTICITNNSMVTGMPVRIFQCINGGGATRIDPSSSSDYSVIAPGGVLCKTVSLVNGNLLTCFYAEYFDDNGWHTQQGSGSDDVSGTNPGPGGTDDSGSNTNGWNFPADQYPAGTNGTVNDDALLKALRELANQLRGIGGGGSINTGNGYLGQIATNTGVLATNLSIGLSNVAQENTLKGLTNLLGSKLSTLQGTMNSNAAQAHGDFMNLTNMMGGSNGIAARIWGLVPTSATNAASATNSAGSLISSLLGGVDGNAAGAAIGTKPTVPQGSTNGMVLSLGTIMTLNLDPESWAPGLMAAIKAVWTFLVLAAFAMWAGKLYFETTKVFATVQTGGVPDLNASVEGFTFGAGGNIAGVIVALAVPIAFITVSIVIVKLLIGWLLSNLGLIPAAGAAMTFGANNIALYLLHSCFPVDLILTLLFLRMTLPFTIGHIVVGCAGAARFLWGK